MGNFISVQPSCDPCLQCCLDCVLGEARYFCQLEDNLEALSTANGRLLVFYKTVMRSIMEAEQRGMTRNELSEDWTKNVQAKKTEVEVVLKQADKEVKNLCLGSCCSKDPWSSYQYGKTVAKLLKELEDLTGKVNTENIAYKPLAEAVVERPSEPTPALQIIINNVWSFLDEEEPLSIIGLFGMGGVGKTALLTQINNKFLNWPKKADIVIWITVSNKFKPERVQEEIGRRMGLTDDGKWKEKSIDEKAVDILRAMRKKKFVLLLDDVWERLDLVKIGVPHKQKGSKIVFTTRSKEVLSQMDAETTIHLKPLSWNDAWELFLEKIGQEALLIHPHIPYLAKSIARKCQGLPLALVTVARAMACRRTLQEWNHAVELLNSQTSDFQAMGDKVLTILKYSYDSLPDDRTRSCFLYCTLFPKNFKIPKSDLVDYWICEEFWDDYDNGASARDKGYHIIGIMVRACLLEDEGDYVKMHDIIHDMGLWIACNSEMEREKENRFVRAGAQLIEAPDVRKWEQVRRMSLMENSIRVLNEVPTSPNLLTLFLCYNPNMVMISSDFFESMKSLTVLDLSKSGIQELPSGISHLVSLQYLNVSHTMISQLPPGLMKLEKLKHLNLEHNENLSVIPGQLTTRLSILQDFRILGSGSARYRHAEDNLLADDNVCIKELQNLKNLNRLSITIRRSSALQSLFSTHKLRSCVEAIALEHFSGSDSLNISWLANMNHLLTYPNELIATSVMQPLGGLHDSSILRTRNFGSLREVRVGQCFHLQDLTWLILAPNLTVLGVTMCRNLEEIISIEKLGFISKIVNPFARLQVLELRNLPQIRSIYPKVLPFPFLQKIEVFSCPMLKKLPVDSDSAKGCKVVIEAEEHWWNVVERENYATKAAFSRFIFQSKQLLPFYVSNPWRS